MHKIEITPELIAELKKKAQAATPGPWVKAGSDVKTSDGGSICLYTTWQHDARYIAAFSPDIVLALLDHIGMLEKQADWLAENMADIEDEEGLPYCPHATPFIPEFCDYDIEQADDAYFGGYLPCTGITKNCWRGAARKAAEESNA